MEEYLRKLKDKLSESLPEDEASRQALMYKERIEERVRAGEKEEDILAEHGDPEELAADISESTIKKEINNPEYGFKVDFSGKDGWSFYIDKLKINSWFGTLVILLVVFGIFQLIRHWLGGM